MITNAKNVIASFLFKLSFSGCVTNANCPGGYTCQDHICEYPPGKVLIESITVRTKTGCSDCSKEGVTLSLLGEKNGNYLNGVPCATRTLDHSGSTDYDGSNGSAARFDGTLGGAENDAERTMMGGCYQVGPIYTLSGNFQRSSYKSTIICIHENVPYQNADIPSQAPLNAQVNGGTMVWQGAGTWAPLDICIDWMSDNFAWQCSTTLTSANSWDLVNCHDLTPMTKCDNLTMSYMV